MKKAFTVLEMVVLMAIIAILVVAAIPGFLATQKAKEKAGWKENVKEVKSPAVSPAVPKSSLEITNQFFAALQNMAQNPARGNEYRATINKLANVIRNEVGKNPQAMEPFLQEIIDLATKAGPGMALLLQDYANEAVKQEMTRLRQESNMVKLAEKEKQIETLKTELGKLKTAQGEKDQKNKEENNRLKTETGRLKDIAQERDKLASSVTALQTELEQLKTAESEKDKEIQELKNKLGLTAEQGVPVLLQNGFFPWGLGSNYNLNFKLINETTKKYLIYKVLAGEELVINLPPGDYAIEAAYNGETVATIKKTVTREPSYFYNNKSYHCVVKAQKTKKILQ
ncbi:MAG: hypothetical protein WC610_02215 [Patescibacteria group bacterium]